MTSPEWCAWVSLAVGSNFGMKWCQVSLAKAITCGSTGTQAGGWFNKEINSADDLKGLKCDTRTWRTGYLKAGRYHSYSPEAKFMKPSFGNLLMHANGSVLTMTTLRSFMKQPNSTAAGMHEPV